MTNFDLSEDKFVRQPSGRRWSAPVSEHRNEAPRWASLTPSSVLTSWHSQIAFSWAASCNRESPRGSERDPRGGWEQ